MNFWEKLEADALACSEDPATVAAVSLAISAKRIADAIEKANEPILEMAEPGPTEEEIAARPGNRIANALDKIVAEIVASKRGTCRICGCSQFDPCDSGCGWADASQTLCDNPECLKKAGAQ